MRHCSQEQLQSLPSPPRPPAFKLQTTLGPALFSLQWKRSPSRGRAMMRGSMTTHHTCAGAPNEVRPSGVGLKLWRLVAVVLPPLHPCAHIQPPLLRAGVPRAAFAALPIVLMVVLATHYLPPLLSGRAALEAGLPLPGGGRLLTPAQLQRYDGQYGRPLYLAVMGEVYDVTPGSRFYGGCSSVCVV